MALIERVKTVNDIVVFISHDAHVVSANSGFALVVGQLDDAEVATLGIEGFEPTHPYDCVLKEMIDEGSIMSFYAFSG